MGAATPCPVPGACGDRAPAALTRHPQVLRVFGSFLPFLHCPGIPVLVLPQVPPSAGSNPHPSRTKIKTLFTLMIATVAEEKCSQPADNLPTCTICSARPSSPCQRLGNCGTTRSDFQRSAFSFHISSKPPGDS